MPRLATKSPAPTVIPDDISLPPKFPELPDDVLKRFPSLNDWEEDTDAWWSRANSALQSSNNWVSQTVTNVINQTGDLRISINGATAAIATETEARITADEILARRIVTVSAIAGVSTNIKVQGTAPVGPAVSDFWVDNSDFLNPITYQWSGVAWVEVTEPISVAAVAAEQTARITADGFLQGKYTLTVVAGNVVTGMNITSSTGTGTDISSVIFNATNFLIYNGVTGVAMFNVAGSDVQLAATLTVSTSGKVYIGAGNYGNADTGFYVDSASQFSLGTGLIWGGGILTVNGVLNSTSGIIGGYTIGSTTLTGSGTGNNAMQLDSSNGGLFLGTHSASTKQMILGAGGISADHNNIDAFSLGSTGAAGGGQLLLSNAAGVTNVVLDAVGGTGGHSLLTLATAGIVRLRLDASDRMITFDGDTNLYRFAADTLRTDDTFMVGGTLQFGTYTAGVLAPTGSIAVKDFAGNVRNVLVG